MIICKSCKNIIDNKYYKCLWHNDFKTDLKICQSCWCNFYLTKPQQFRVDHPLEYNLAMKKNIIL